MSKSKRVSFLVTPSRCRQCVNRAELHIQHVALRLKGAPTINADDMVAAVRAPKESPYRLTLTPSPRGAWSYQNGEMRHRDGVRSFLACYMDSNSTTTRWAVTVAPTNGRASSRAQRGRG